ncbi:MAG: hypothetical protein J6125_04910 [Clostridia bacterium]|nr:hypothetical protein [Clostridia bacterium]
MKRIGTLLLCLLLLACMVLPAVSCKNKKKNGDDTTTPVQTAPPTTDPTDPSTDPPVVEPTKWDNVNFGGATVKFQLSTNDAEYTSGGKAYMAGPDETTSNTVQNLVYQRNSAARDVLGINPTYVYWDKGWSQVFPEIETTENTGNDCPDAYCDMIYDMMAATMRGLFRNVKTLSVDYVAPDGSQGGYFDVRDEYGYMTEFMRDLALGTDKQYLLGNQYYMDLIRTMMVMPVNLDMYEAKCGDVSQFYQDIIDGEWTWDYLINLSKKVYTDKTGNGNSYDDILGFAAETDGGMSASGIVYATRVAIIDTELQSDGTYLFTYKADNKALYDIFDKIKQVFSANGVLAVTGQNGTTNTHVKQIREKFATDTLLFGGCIMMGAVEEEVYQDMNTQFGLVPIPKMSVEADYNTLIHNTGRCGAISLHAQNPEAASAWIQYCSENSGAIMNEYYNYAMKYKYTSDAGTMEMLDMIYENIVSVREKALEDLVGINSSDANQYKWHSMLIGSPRDYKSNADQIGTLYATAIQVKQAELDKLVKSWKNLP